MRNLLQIAICLVLTCAAAFPAQAQPVMERLGRGVVAVPAGDGFYISWRLLADDGDHVTFNIYRSTDGGKEVRLNSTPIAETTDFTELTSAEVEVEMDKTEGERKQFGSPTLNELPSNLLPAEDSACQHCLVAVWLVRMEEKDKAEVRCWCRLLNAFSYTEQEPNPIVLCDGTYLTLK